VNATDVTHPRSALLAGAVDSHVHAAPFVNADTFLVDAFELATAAKAAGLSAVVLKSYFGSSCPAAYLANRHAGGATVVGGITLNRSVGGFNAEAVKASAYEGAHAGFRPGRVVWMPERSSLHRARLLGIDETGMLSPFPGGDPSKPLIPEAREVLDVIAEEDLVLATSHLGPEEALAFLAHAADLGVTRFVITHASNPGVSWSTAQKKRAVELGAYIEEAAICWEPAMSLFHYTPVDAKREILEPLHEIGPQHYLLASDGGFRFSPSPPEAMRVFVELLHADGFTEAEIRQMAVENPRNVFRLDTPDPRPGTTRDRLGV
jgi:hypothetical protein